MEYGPKRKIRLLLVDDDRDFSYALAPRFAKNNFEVTQVFSAEEALDIFSPEDFDIVIIDLKLPGINGMEFLSEIRKLDEDIPAIVLTGYATLESAKAAVELNAADYLLKPLRDIDEILSPIYKAVYNRELKKKNIRLLEELKRKISDLEKAERKYRDLFEMASDLICVVNGDGTIDVVNKKVEEVTGYSADELRGKRLEEVFIPLDTEKSESGSGADPCEPGQICVIRILTKSGEERLGEMLSRVVETDENGKVVQYGIRDITVRRKIEMGQKLVLMGEMMAQMAHEINALLSIIMIKAETVLLEEGHSPQIQKTMEMIREQIRLACNVLSRFLTFAKQKKETEDFAYIHDVIDLVTDLVEFEYSINKITIVKDLMPETLCISMGREQLCEIVMNLMRNSKDAIGSGGGVITISSGREGDMVLLSIKDTGNGMSNEEIEKIFTPFYTTKKDGIGLGVTICRDIVKKHGGTLSFESSPGNGTTAKVLFPACSK